MKKIADKLKTALILISLLMFSFSSSAQAQTDLFAIQGYLNGVTTQQLVNQSNKPQYADKVNAGEFIDPMTGALTYKERDLSLPGKDGLDLNIGRVYSSSQSEIGTKKLNVLYSNEDTSSSRVYGYYIFVREYNSDTGIITDRFYGVWDEYSDAYDVYAYFNNRVDGPREYYTNPPNQQKYWIDVDDLTTAVFVVHKNARYNYLRSRYDLGAGWALAFSSIQMENEDGTDYLYYHDGEGACYRVIFTTDQTDSNLENYQGKDVQLVQDSGTYSYNGVASAYKFIAADKRTTYFASDGRIIGIVDRFGNQIKFKHIDRTINDQYYPYISQITDSVGRTVDFTYENTINESEETFDGENITITVHDPANIKTLQIIYTKSRSEVSYMNNNQATDTFYTPVLYSVTNTIGEKTYYDSTISGAGIRFRYDTKDLTSAMAIPGITMTGVRYQNVYTKYYYGYKTRNLGVDGACKARYLYRRYDRERRWNSQYNQWEYTGVLNDITSNPVKDYTGYPDYDDAENLPASYQIYSETTVQSNGLLTKTIFNGLKQFIQEETTAANGEKKVVKNLTFDFTYIFNPTKTEISKYASDGTLISQLYVATTYKDWGGVESVTQPLTAAQLNDANTKSKYITTYTYGDTIYKYFVTQSQWWQNNSTQLSESYTYDSLGRVLTYVNPKGETTNYSYSTVTEGDKTEVTKQLDDGKTAKTVTIYGNETGKAYPTATKDYYTNNQGVYTETQATRTYDMLLGLVATETDNSGKTTTYNYDSLGRPTSIEKPSFTNIDGQTYSVEEQIAYDYSQYLNDDTSIIEENRKLGVLQVYTTTAYIDSSNNTTKYSEAYSCYDGYGNLRLQKVYDGTQWVIKSQFGTDDLSRIDYAQDGENNTNTYAYDVWGRPYETTDSFGNLIKTEYDWKNNKARKYFVAQANVAAYRADLANNNYKESVLDVILDQWERPVQRKAYPNWPNTTGEISELYSYDIAGSLITYTDPNRSLNADGCTKKYTYDQLNRMVQVKDALNQLTDITYTKLGDVKSIQMRETSSSQPVTLYTKTYDELGQMTKKTDPSSKNESYAYNSLGLNVQYTDRMGNVFTNTYDEHYQMTSNKGVRNDSGISEEYKYLYDNPFGASRVSDIYNNTAIGEVDYQYNIGTGELTAKSIEYTAENYVSNLLNGYDKSGKLTSSAIGKEGLVNYFYTNYKYDRTRLNKVQTNGAQAEDTTGLSYANYEYYPDGKLKKITYPQLSDSTYLTTEYTYNKLSNLTTVVNKKGTTVLSQYSYAYDNNGNITAVTDSAGTTTYVYDKLDRLTEVHRPGGAALIYTYDLKGNRKTLQDNNPTLNIGNTSYTYDVRDRLSSVTKGTETTSFKYGPDGLRDKKVTPSKTVEYHYNLAEKVVAESDGAGGITANYIWGPDRVLAKKDQASGSQYYYLFNGHGDVVQVVDSSGNVVNNYTYDEWGNILNQTEGIDSPFKYAGEIFDESSGLYYLRARYYDPQLGRFINEDSYEGQIDNPLSLNLYTYCHNNPSYYIDPSGNSVAGAALPLAGGAALADGPVPVGDAIGLGILGGALIIDGGIWVYHKVNAPKPTQQKSSQLPSPKPPKPPKPTLAEQITKITTASAAIQQYIDKWGIRPFNQFGQKLIEHNRKLREAGMEILERHHIIPQRFADIIGMNPNDMKCIPLPRSLHQLFTNAWDTAIPKAPSARPDLHKIYYTALEIYKDFPEIIKIIKRAMEVTGTK